ncbi:MAG: Arc family DNA-binding protein [Deltaproteobacteria bacterium]|nr:Arc family DNA-binding protein [Deltaproteobacteria bacterium]
MARTLTLRNVPENVVRALRERAKRNQRSMQAELLAIVEEAAVDRRSLEEQLAACRSVMSRPMETAEIDECIVEGRP